MKQSRVIFPSGELTLEGIISVPSGAGQFPAVVLCHPHPLYGGSMDNNIIDSLAETLTQSSIIAFKFNFRGVGLSQGEFSDGVGEQDDVIAAIDFAAAQQDVDPKKLGLAGYSAGAAFGMPAAARDPRIKALAGISPPPSMSDFNFLKDCVKPKFLMCGGRDMFIPGNDFNSLCRIAAEPKECQRVDSADHFWWGYEALLAARVTAFFKRCL